MIQPGIPYVPYVGMRPFEEAEAEFFFGRDEEIDELLRRIGSRSRFLAITGPSGCGKSSLIRAGFLPALQAGLLTGAGSQWRIAVFRPGLRPCSMLAAALIPALGQPDVDHVEQTLRRSSLGLIDAVRQAWLGPQENLLICVDQLEEILRINSDDRDEASAFVKLLFEATCQRDIPIYVLLTFRSDFLGEFADFRHLPEAFDEGLFLMPRMKRDQLRLAIVGPLDVMGASMTNRLTQRILNDFSDHPDYLILMQHALRRTWQAWKVSNDGAIDLVHYLSVGGTAALEHHAEEVFAELSQNEGPVARKLFQRLTGRGPDSRAFRRPTLLSDLCAVTEQSKDTIQAVIDRFYCAGLLFRAGVSGDEVIDLAHEGLIRQWPRLQEWIKEEAQSAALYLELAHAAQRHSAGQASLWRGPELENALRWLQDKNPNRAWAERYNPQFEEVVRFVEESKHSSEQSGAKSRRPFWRRLGQP